MDVRVRLMTCGLSVSIPHLPHSLSLSLILNGLITSKYEGMRLFPAKQEMMIHMDERGGRVELKN